MSNYFEDFQPGQAFKHWPGRTVTEFDNTWFTLMTLNTNPLHFDAAFAAKSQHGQQGQRRQRAGQCLRGDGPRPFAHPVAAFGGAWADEVRGARARDGGAQARRPADQIRARGQIVAAIRSEAAGVADRITFEVSNGANLPARIFYFVATFDVVHDAIDPHGLMAGIRRSLKDDSTYLVQEVNVSDKVGENLRPLGKMI